MATEQQYTEAIEYLEETYGTVPPPLDTIPEDDAVQERPTRIITWYHAQEYQ
jgi:hypothetical protein